MMRTLIGLTAATLWFSVIACTNSSGIDPDTGESVRLRRASRKNVVSATPPPNAIDVHGTPTIVLVPGFGKVHPEIPSRPLVGIGHIAYTAEGKEVSSRPFTLLDVRSLTPEWRRIVMSMVAGEIRRAWVSEQTDRVRVVDIELEAIGVSPKP